uniref:Pteropsin protein n=1 Tax=Asiagomphus melaenops TaxID=507849 RepID=A0A0C6G6R1_9ODON|nr:opsin, pteropsin type [Asiagomphus melaenops]
MKSPWETETDGAGGGNEVGGGDSSGPGTEEEERLLMSPGGYAAAAVALLLIGLVGFVSNLLVMVLMFKNKQLWTPLNVILFNLVCSDFSVSILGNPITLTAALYRRWIFGRTVCVIYGFFMSLLGIASITTMMVLSFERYVMISKPFQVHRLSQKGAVGLIVAIWVYALALTMPPLFGWGDYVHESANISCSVNWESKTISATTYIIFLFAMGLVVPVSVISFSYLNIIWTMKKNALAMGRLTKAESRVTLMVFVMIVAFLVAWTPYSVLALLVAFGDASLISPGVAVVPALMAKSSICYNPVIYVGLNTQFRSAWHKLLGVRAISETSQELGGEHTAVLSPSNYMSHTVLEGGATTGTSASGIHLAPVSSTTSNSSSPNLAATKKRKAATALITSTGNGETSKGTKNWIKSVVSEALPEEVEESDDQKGQEEVIDDDLLEENDSVERNGVKRANGDVEAGVKLKPVLEVETGRMKGVEEDVREESETKKNGDVELKVPLTAGSDSSRDVNKDKFKDNEPGSSGSSEKLRDGSGLGNKGRRLRGGGFLRGRYRKSEGRNKKVVVKGNGILSEFGKSKAKQRLERCEGSKVKETSIVIDDDEEEVEMSLLSKPKADGPKTGKVEAVVV